VERIRFDRTARAAARACSLLLVLCLVATAAPGLAADVSKGSGKGASMPPVFFTGKPDAATFLAARQGELDAAQKTLDRLLAVKGKRTIENTLVPFNEVVTLAENAVYGAYIMEQTHPDSAFRAQAEPMTQKASKFLDDLSLNRGVYDALKEVDVKKADAATRYFHEKMLRDFRRAGVDRDEAVRKLVSTLNDELTKTGQEFSKNIREDSKKIQVDGPEALKGLPEDFVRAHPAGPDGKVTLSIETPDYIPVIRYADDSELRRRMMHARENRAYPQNMAVLDSLIAKRHRLATMLGYAHWADYITEDKMIESGQNAAEFIQRLRETTFRRAQEEYAMYLERKREDDPAATQVNRWETAYYGRLIRKRDYDFDPQEARPYFPFERVKKGVLDVTSTMFGVTYRKLDTPVWHESVEAYEVYDGSKLLGRFFLDLHPRPGKYNHAAKFTIRQGVAGVQVPEHALVCNFPGGKQGDPGLMEHSDVETFFHEFGHLVHAILGGQGRWEPVSGTATQRDFVEAPSQMLEEWCWDAKVLQTFAKHHETGQPIPAELVEKMRRADAFGRSLNTATQALYSAISLNIYNKPPHQVNTDAIVAELEPQFTPVPRMQDTHMQTSFGHLDGYSAVYYTYMWSLVISKDMFSVFDRENLLDPKVARRYRDRVLAPGGTKPAKELVRDFLGRDYKFDAFDEWLAEGTRRVSSGGGTGSGSSGSVE
jgi:thimet oligopeptidase